MKFLFSEFGIFLLKLIAFSIGGGWVRLFFSETSIKGGMRQMFGGIVFGAMIGYLFHDIQSDSSLYEYTGKYWHLWTFSVAMFGKELFIVCRATVITGVPQAINYLIAKGLIAWDAVTTKKDKDVQP